MFSEEIKSICILRLNEHKPNGSAENVLYKVPKARSCAKSEDDQEVALNSPRDRLLQSSSSPQKPTVDRVVASNHYVENPKLSLRRGTAWLDMFRSGVRSAFKNVGMKFYHTKIFHQSQTTNITKRREFSQTIATENTDFNVFFFLFQWKY